MLVLHSRMSPNETCIQQRAYLTHWELPYNTRILVADDHQIVRAGLKNLLSDYTEFAVEGEAGSGTEAVKMVRESEWDIVLLDVSMPDMNGVDTLKQIKRTKPELPVLILSMPGRSLRYQPAPRRRKWIRM